MSALVVRKTSREFPGIAPRPRRARRPKLSSRREAESAHAVSSRAAAQQVQGLRRRQQRLRARAAAQQVQGVRRQRSLRARSAAPQVQGLRQQCIRGFF